MSIDPVRTRSSAFASRPLVDRFLNYETTIEQRFIQVRSRISDEPVMNVFSYVLAEDSVDAVPDKSSTKFVVDDNIGEAIHIHLRNVRLETSVDDFELLARNLEHARRKLDDGNR